MNSTIPNWEPLQEQIGERCAEWMWMYQNNGLEHYKHRDTRRYLILDSLGIAWVHREEDGMLIPGDFEQEYRRATFGYSTEGRP